MANGHPILLQPGCHIEGTAWSTKRHLNIELLKDQQMRGAPLSPN
jgi:hypothetical protein